MNSSQLPENRPPFEQALQLTEAIGRQLKRVISGQDEIMRDLLASLTAGGHVLLEGVPGVAKTLLARCLSCAIEARFARIQFTPDLMPSDITGVNVYQPETGEFSFRQGPLFNEIVLADEINRAPAKTQSALLEAMQEQQVSIDGETRQLPALFFVLATQNPIEYEGTYPLPEAQLDRFLMKISIQYPSLEAEREMLDKMHRLGPTAARPSETIQAVARPEEILQLRRLSHQVEVDESVRHYIVDVIRQSRAFDSLSLGASPRAAVALLQAAKALAVLEGRFYATPDDVKAMSLPVLRHRVRLTPEAEIEGLHADDCLRALLEQVAVPRFSPPAAEAEEASAGEPTETPS
ncbi:MAG TPA: MoxR family ATPase [Acidobacteriota bacterium]|nr:MoxR family ATPase [Acidobacteriota bacterium]